MRYALGVEYDGSDFRGWQNLGEGGPSVQASLEQALSSVADAPLQVVCAGRTDAGVHGQCQVVHFDTDVVRDPRAWMLGTTTRLPRSIAVRWPGDRTTSPDWTSSPRRRTWSPLEAAR